MPRKTFFILCAFLVLLIVVSGVLVIRQVSAEPGDIPKYENLFKKILASEDLSVDENGDIVNNGRIESTRRINAYDWERLKQESGGKVIEWADLDVEDISCPNGYVTSVGTTSTCGNFVGTFVAVAGTSELPSTCPEGSVYVEDKGRCFKLIEIITCAGSSDGSEREGDHLFCYSGKEVKYCHFFYRGGISQVDESTADCLSTRGKGTLQKKCSHGKVIYNINDPRSINCRNEEVQTCPEGYNIDEDSSNDNQLVCVL